MSSSRFATPHAQPACILHWPLLATYAPNLTLRLQNARCRLQLLPDSLSTYAPTDVAWPENRFFSSSAHSIPHSTALMDKKQGAVHGHVVDTATLISTTVQPTGHVEAYNDLPSLFSSLSTSYGWAHLPIDVLLLVVGYASFGVVVRLASVDRRLHQLVLEPRVSVSSRNSIWHSYPAMTFDVRRRYHQAVLSGREVSVGGDHISCRGSGAEHLSSLLSFLRHVTELHLVFRYRKNELKPNGVPDEVPSGFFSSLHRFTRLRSLELRHVQTLKVDAFADAIVMLPSLTCLELNAYKNVRSDALTKSLHRLCSTQLDALTLPQRQLSLLARTERGAMPRLRSLTVTPGVTPWEENHYFPAGSWLVDHFPSLLHLTVACHRIAQTSDAIPLPLLSSINTLATTRQDFSKNSAHLFRLCCPAHVIANCRRRQMATVLLRAPPNIRQLSLSDGRFNRVKSHRANSIFPPRSAAPRVPAILSHVVYLDFLDGLTIVDLVDLLSPMSPPVFAAQLTHLALRGALEG